MTEPDMTMPNTAEPARMACTYRRPTTSAWVSTFPDPGADITLFYDVPDLVIKMRPDADA